jgi:hypothetical protein
MARVLWESEGILFVEFLKMDTTLIPEREMQVLEELKHTSRWIQP